jgi:hypothetical protein
VTETTRENMCNCEGNNMSEQQVTYNMSVTTCQQRLDALFSLKQESMSKQQHASMESAST